MAEEKKYLLIRPDEDGEPCRFLTEKEMRVMLSNPKEEVGVVEFLDTIPDDDSVYWKDETGLLLEIKILKPKIGGYYLEGD